MTTTTTTAKNRNREAPSFANINLLGRCNVDCFFCLGKDIEDALSKHNQTHTHFNEWRNFEPFLDYCLQHGVNKLYITGQNTDSLVYEYLEQLILHLKDRGFQVGLRTNGYLALRKMDVINLCDLSAGYSIHSLDPVTNKMILGRASIPDWNSILALTERPRVSVVVNRCNEHEIFSLLRYLSNFRNVRYVQLRKVSTDTRQQALEPDQAAYERVYTQIARVFGPPQRRFVADAEAYQIYGKEVVLWRTVRTSVNSFNYFTDGTVSDLYFVVEGYLKYRDKTPPWKRPVPQPPLATCSGCRRPFPPGSTVCPHCD